MAHDLPRLLPSIAVALALFGPTDAADAQLVDWIDWLNPAGGDWSDPTNWQDGVVPTLADDARFTLAGAYTVRGPGLARYANVARGDLAFRGQFNTEFLLVMPEDGGVASLHIADLARSKAVYVGPEPGRGLLTVTGRLLLTDVTDDVQLHTVSIGEFPSPFGGVPQLTEGGEGSLRVIGPDAYLGPEKEDDDVRVLLPAHIGPPGRLEVLDGATVVAGDIGLGYGAIEVSGDGSTLRAERLDVGFRHRGEPFFERSITVRDGAEMHIDRGDSPRIQLQSDPIDIVVDGGVLTSERISIYAPGAIAIRNGGHIVAHASLEVGVDALTVSGDGAILQSNRIALGFSPEFARARAMFFTNHAQLLVPFGGFFALAGDTIMIRDGAQIAHGVDVPDDMSSPPNSFNWLSLGASSELHLSNRVQIDAIGLLRLSAMHIDIAGPQTRIETRGVGENRPPGGGAGGRPRTIGVIHLSGRNVHIHNGVHLHGEGAIVDAPMPLDPAHPSVRFDEDVTLDFDHAINLRSLASPLAASTPEIVVARGAILRAPQISIAPDEFDYPPEAGPIVSGEGVLIGEVINAAILAPGEGVGAMTIIGPFTQAESLAFMWDRNPGQGPRDRLLSPGALHIDIATTGRPRADRLDVSGEATLDGQLAFFTHGPGQIRPGDYVFLAAASVVGEFASVALPDLPRAMRASVVYQPTRVLLRVRARADLTGDRRVNGRDLAALLARWNTLDPTADLNDDGVVNGPDLAELLASWDD